MSSGPLVLSSVLGLAVLVGEALLARDAGTYGSASFHSSTLGGDCEFPIDPCGRAWLSKCHCQMDGGRVKPATPRGSGSRHRDSTPRASVDSMRSVGATTRRRDDATA